MISTIREIYAGRNAYTGTLQLPHPSLELWRQRLEDLPSNVYSLLAEIDGKVVGQAGLLLNKTLVAGMWRVLVWQYMIITRAKASALHY